MQTQERFDGRGWGEGDDHERDSTSQEDEIGPIALLKNVRNDDRDGKEICRWRSVNDIPVEDKANDDNVGERGATTADNRDDGGNGKEGRINDDNDGGKDWGDVNAYNNGGGVTSLFSCLPPIIVHSNRDCNGGGIQRRRRRSRPPPRN